MSEIKEIKAGRIFVTTDGRVMKIIDVKYRKMILICFSEVYGESEFRLNFERGEYILFENQQFNFSCRRCAWLDGQKIEINEPVAPDSIEPVCFIDDSKAGFSCAEFNPYESGRAVILNDNGRGTKRDYTIAIDLQKAMNPYEEEPFSRCRLGLFK